MSETSIESGDGLALDPGRAGEGRSARRIIAVGGGKGGAGKSLLASNVAIFLTTLGKRVVLVDADVGGANLHTFVGVERPRLSLSDLLERRVARVEDLVVETAVPGLGLVSGEVDAHGIARPPPARDPCGLADVQRLDVDFLVVDLGPGTSSSAIDVFLQADVGVLVVVPEPTSVENTYRFVKAAFLRRLISAGIEPAPLIKEGGLDFESGIPAPQDLLAAARARGDDALVARLRQEMAAFRPRIVVNQVRARSDLDLGTSLVSACRRRLGLTVDYLGHLEHDDAVWVAVRKRRPLLVEHPESRVAKCVERVARRLLALDTDKTPPGAGGVDEPSHYEILEVEPTATHEEIRRAYRRVREIYGADSMLVCGLYDRDRLLAVHRQIEAAYDTLMDTERRRAYDLSLFPEGLPPGQRAAVGAALATTVAPMRESTTAPSHRGDAPGGEPGAADAQAPPPPEPVIAPGADITGALLRQVREARGIDLHVISQKTKIGVGHLRAIEEERFRVMPAVVYVRGFLVEYAKFLRLDVDQVLSTYLPRYRAVRAELDEERGD